MARSKRDKERLRARRAAMTPEEKRAHADRVLKDYRYYAKHDPTFLLRMAARKKQNLQIQRISAMMQEAMDEIYRSAVIREAMDEIYGVK